MKELLMLICTGLAVVGLITWQLKIIKKHHPNAELLIDLFKLLNANQKTARKNLNG